MVDAVQCGKAAQEELQARNTDPPKNGKRQSRSRINSGDVIEEGEEIYRDRVNIAARLEKYKIGKSRSQPLWQSDFVFRKVASTLLSRKKAASSPQHLVRL